MGCSSSSSNTAFEEIPPEPQTPMRAAQRQGEAEMNLMTSLEEQSIQEDRHEREERAEDEGREEENTEPEKDEEMEDGEERIKRFYVDNDKAEVTTTYIIKSNNKEAEEAMKSFFERNTDPDAEELLKSFMKERGNTDEGELLKMFLKQGTNPNAEARKTFTEQSTDTGELRKTFTTKSIVQQTTGNQILTLESRSINVVSTKEERWEGPIITEIHVDEYDLLNKTAETE
nr:uncharacterized protein LOC129281841 [Lytechinus pictus]